MINVLLLLLALAGIAAALVVFVIKLPMLSRAPSQLPLLGRIIWALVFVFISVSAICIVLSGMRGWSAGLYQLWYVTGILFPLAYLGQAAVFLVAGRKTALISLLVLLIGSVVSLILVLNNPVSGGVLKTNGITASIHLASWLLNAYGFLAVVFSAVWVLRHFLWNGSGRLRVLGAFSIFVGYLLLKAALAQFGSGLPQPAAILAGIAAIILLLAGIILVVNLRSSTSLSPEQLHRRRYLVKAGSIGFGATALLGAIALLPVFPILMGIDTNFKSVYISALPTAKDFDGIFLVTDQGDMQVYSWNIEPDDFPTDAPTLDASTVHQLVVIQSQFDVPEHYELHNLTTGERVTWQSISQEGRNLTLFTGSLDPGDYEFLSPTDSMYGGSTYEFFTLK